MLKFIYIRIRSYIKNFLNKIGVIITFGVPLFSVVIFLLILAPEVFGRVPSLSFFISEKSLPVTYSLQGSVAIFDQCKEIIDEEVEIHIGGYRGTTKTGEKFEITFTSPLNSEIFVVFTYEINGQEYAVVKSIQIEGGIRKLEKTFNLYI